MRKSPTKGFENSPVRKLDKCLGQPLEIIQGKLSKNFILPLQISFIGFLTPNRLKTYQMHFSSTLTRTSHMLPSIKILDL